MKTLFNYDGGIMNACRSIMYVSAANLLFLLCSLPIITVGASATAMYTVLARYQQHKEPLILHTFFTAFRENFKKATIIWGGMLLVLVTLVINFVVLYSFDGTFATAGRVVLNLILIMWAVAWMYVFPTMALYENSCRGYLEYAFGYALGKLPTTLVLFVVWAGMLFGLLFLSQYLPLAVLLLCAFGFSIPANLTVKTLLKDIEE
ncbi:YesL family protein [Ruminococcus gauvreauii]|uniref:DUF624 domain-containing protein n=1 Tax=Ruminococcus gauvreauii TaxID=438033 RepID=A0ABY5VE95_9FIRM|nr:DUF624 domain-containing protein [Ruminococcus gauvreauii]UWP58830.1 DUF624 domain-containing protein [Ruminococcus gauvreauii]